MKICYIGHEYHRKTASTNFMADLLEAGATEFHRRDTLPDPATLAAFDLDALADENYDLICVFQIEMLAKAIAERRLTKRLVFVPMFDGARMLSDDYWQTMAARDDVRVINFSSTLHHQVASLGVNSFFFRFYPQPVTHPVWDRLKNHAPQGVFLAAHRPAQLGHGQDVGRRHAGPAVPPASGRRSVVARRRRRRDRTGRAPAYRVDLV